VGHIDRVAVTEIEVTQIFEAGDSEPFSSFQFELWREFIRTMPKQSCGFVERTNPIL